MTSQHYPYLNFFIASWVIPRQIVLYLVFAPTTYDFDEILQACSRYRSKEIVIVGILEHNNLHTYHPFIQRQLYVQSQQVQYHRSVTNTLAVERVT